MCQLYYIIVYHPQVPSFELLARTCMHPSAYTDDIKGVKQSSQGKQIIKNMFTYVWPKDRPEIKARVVLAVTLLVGAKVHGDHLSFYNKQTAVV